MKSHIHDDMCSKRFGGRPENYSEINFWFDETKAHFGDNRHRALRHHSLGIFEAERVFGETIINSDGKTVSVRDIGEFHVFSDLGFIPTVGDYLCNMAIQDWMYKRDGSLPPSLQQINPNQNKPADEMVKIIEKYKQELEKNPIHVPPTIYPPRNPWEQQILD